MTNDERMTNRTEERVLVGASSFVIDADFVIRISSLYCATYFPPVNAR